MGLSNQVRVSGFGFRVSGLGFRLFFVEGLFRCFRVRAQIRAGIPGILGLPYGPSVRLSHHGFGFRVSGLGFIGFRV